MMKDFTKIKYELKFKFSKQNIFKQINILIIKFTKKQVVRKTIAKYLTVINDKRRSAVKQEYKGKSLKPLDVRVKKTRAIRRKLTKKQRDTKLAKTQKVLDNFGLRKFAVKA